MGIMGFGMEILPTRMKINVVLGWEGA